MSTPRKRTKAEAERVRQINLLARLWRSKAMADGLLAGRPVVPARGFALWLQQYTQAFLHESLKRRGSPHINQTKLTGYITYLGANRRRQGESPVLMTEAVIETRRVVEARRNSKAKAQPFPKTATEEMHARYQRVVGRILARAFLPIAGWDRLAWMFEESIWKSRVNWTRTLDELAAEQGKTLDKQP